MVGLATIAGGMAKSGLVALNPAEQHAAQQALAKLAGATTSQATGSTASYLSASTQNAATVGSLSTLPTLSSLNAGGSGLLSGHGTDTFAGGVASAGHSLAGFASDTVVGGSAATSVLPSGTTTAGFNLSADTINVAGATATGVSVQDPAQAHTAVQTITLADKTTVTITGVPSHNIIKSH